MVDAAAKTGRDVGNYVLMMVIADETDEKAMEKWELYNKGADMGAIAWMSGQADADPNAAEGGTAKRISAPRGAEIGLAVPPSSALGSASAWPDIQAIAPMSAPSL